MIEPEFNLIREQLGSLMYPEYIIEKAILKANKIFYRPRNTDRETIYSNKIKIPYMNNLKPVIEPLEKRNPFVFTYPNTIHSSVVNVYQKCKTKDIGVYAIPCKNCDKAYIGFTTKAKGLPQRIIEHKRSVRYGQQNSAVFKHVSEEGHVFSWSESSVVFGSACRYKCQIMESALIASTNNCNNSQGAFKPDAIDNVILDPYLKRIKHRLHPPPQAE